MTDFALIAVDVSTAPRFKAGTPKMLFDSEVHLHVDVKHVAVAADGIRHGRVADWRVVEAQPLGVHADAASLHRVVVHADAKLRAVAVVTADLAARDVSLQHPA